MHITVTAASYCTIGDARVAVVVITIIASLIAIVAQLQVDTSLAIAAARSAAVVGARVRIFVIGVVTVFAGPQTPVTARGHTTSIGTGIAIETVAIITGLKAFRTLSNIDTLHAITAARDRATVQADIGGILIAIIASLSTLPNKAVAATCDLTGAGARVGVDVIAIIASLFGVELRVTASLGAAVGIATITTYPVTIIASLPGRLKAVAADRQLTGIGTGVDVALIAIVATFTLLNKAVAAAWAGA
jgi:hypothetical protein